MKGRELDWFDDASTVEAVAKQVIRAGRVEAVVLGFWEALPIERMVGAVEAIWAGVWAVLAALSFGFRIVLILDASHVEDIAPHACRAEDVRVVLAFALDVRNRHTLERLLDVTNSGDAFKELCKHD